MVDNRCLIDVVSSALTGIKLTHELFHDVDNEEKLDMGVGSQMTLMLNVESLL